MSVISVNSEHQYDVVIGKPWLLELSSTLSQYSRVAVFFSESQKDMIPQISVEGDVHYFPLPDGEAAKSIQNLAKCGTGWALQVSLVLM